jgi:hypothetical protein
MLVFCPSSNMKLTDLKTTSRTSFNETWLCEMPSGLGSFETFDTLEYSIKDFLTHGLKSEVLHSDLRKIDAGEVLLYWFGTDTEVKLGTELRKKPEALVVSITGKNPRLRGKAPYASDLYAAILKDSGRNIRLVSDTQLSDEGLKLWKKLVKLGHRVSVYDRDEPGESFKSFESPNELDAFFKDDDTNFTRYQFVLSEDVKQFCSMRASFRLRLLRESTPRSVLED